MLDKYPKDVKLVNKNFPLPMHQFARPAAAAALAAQRQGKFWEFHHKLFENSAALNDGKIKDIARELGLNMDKFNKDMNDPAIQNLINRDLDEGGQSDVRGTPTIFVNGKLLKNRSLQGFEQMVETELKKKR